MSHTNDIKDIIAPQDMEAITLENKKREQNQSYNTRLGLYSKLKSLEQHYNINNKDINMKKRNIPETPDSTNSKLIKFSSKISKETPKPADNSNSSQANIIFSSLHSVESLYKQGKITKVKLQAAYTTALSDLRTLTDNIPGKIRTNMSKEALQAEEYINQIIGKFNPASPTNGNNNSKLKKRY